MRNNLIKLTMMLSVILALGMTSCGDDDNTTGEKLEYDLFERDDSEIDGDIEFVELEDGRIQVEIDLSGTESGTSHPAHIHMNSAAMGGDIIISLDAVDGETGSSVTIFDKTDAGDPITFSAIDQLDAYVNVHKSASELTTIIAQGDIGSNRLTGEEKSYDLEERAVDGISGTIVFKKRKNGFTLAEIDLDGTPDGGSHPAHIHMNSAAEGGDILIDLTPIYGNTGKSASDIRLYNDGESLDYEDVITLNGYVNVHVSKESLSTIVAQGDIGLNELTGESISYDLNEKDDSGVSGEVKFEERMDGSIKATIDLDGTPGGGIHPAHIHENSAAEGGPIAVTFNPVAGTTGKSVTTIRQLDDGSSFNYQVIESFNGYINVHLSEAELAIIVSQGNIGVNN